MRFTVQIAATLAIVLLALPTCASLSLNGPTGSANLPTGDIAAPGITIAYDGLDTASSFVQSWRMGYGISPKLELSGNYVATSRTTRGLSAKYLVNEAIGKTAVGFASGTTSAFHITMRPIEGDLLDTMAPPGPPGPGPVGPPVMLVNRINTWQLYVAHTQPIVPAIAGRPALYGTIGVNYTDMSFKSGVVRAFGALEAKFGATSVAIDYQSPNSTVESDSMASIVVRHSLKYGFGIEAGWTNSMGMLGSSASHFFGGANYCLAL